jgi:hypothetical protein
MGKQRSFFSKLVAALLIAAIISPATVQASHQSQEERASKLLEELERVHADTAGTKQRTEKAQRVVLEYAEHCKNDAEVCHEALVTALAKRGYPEASIENFRRLLAEGRRIAEMDGANELVKAKLFTELIIKYPVAMPTGEASFENAVAWSWIGGIAAGAALIIWGVADHRPVVRNIGIAVAIGVTVIAFLVALGE